MPFFVDELEFFTLPRLKAEFRRPAAFRDATAVKLVRGPFVATVELVRVPLTSAYGGVRTFLRCPAVGCGALVNIVAFGPANFGCSRCLKWRWRPQCVRERTEPAEFSDNE